MENSRSFQRRQFLQQAAALGAAAVADISQLESLGVNSPVSPTPLTILFQGDSITDGNRTRNNDWNHVMGHGYAYLVASRLWHDHPAKQLHFLNRGISGNKVPDLATRWQTDVIDLQPNVLSLLVGINDVSALLNGNPSFTASQYETGYRLLLQQTVNRFPGIQLVLCDPFILPVGKVKGRWEAYHSAVEERRMSVKLLSQEFDAVHVPFQDSFNRALKKAPADYWIWDGVHPMPAGHELMAREWIRQVGRRIKFTR